MTNTTLSLISRVRKAIVPPNGEEFKNELLEFLDSVKSYPTTWQLDSLICYLKESNWTKNKIVKIIQALYPERDQVKLINWVHSIQKNL